MHSEPIITPPTPTDVPHAERGDNLERNLTGVGGIKHLITPSRIGAGGQVLTDWSGRCEEAGDVSLPGRWVIFGIVWLPRAQAYRVTVKQLSTPL